MALIDKASLLMVPSTYEDGTLYNVLPSGNKAPDETGNNNGYDQTRADFTFSRGSNLAATRVNADGLIEKGRENLLLQSNQFDTTWLIGGGGSGLTLTGGQADKDGGNTAWLIDEVTNDQAIYQVVSTNGVQTFSIYAKAGTNEWMRLGLGGGAFSHAYFDLVNGVLGNTLNIVDSSIEDAGNGWWRCSVTANKSVNAVYVYPSEANNSAGTNGSIYIQDAQLENGLVATDYIETGSTTATAGVLENTPRIDYSSGAGALLLEPQRTNVLPHSEYFGGSEWTKTNTAVTTNAATSPEGVQNASLVYPTASSSTKWGVMIQEFITGLVSANYTNTFYLKSNGWRWVYIIDPSGAKNVWFDLQEGVVGTQESNATGEIQAMGDGWYKCVVYPHTSPTTYVYAGVFFSDADNSYVCTPNGTNGAYIYGAQSEAGSHVSSYVPTYGSAATRGADSCLDAGNSDVINSTEGVLYAEISALAEDATFKTICLHDGTVTQRINIWLWNNGTFKVDGHYNNVQQFNFDFDADLTATNKIAVKYKANDFSVFLNGSKINSDTSGATPAGLNTLDFRNGNNLYDFYGNVKQVVVFNEALSDSELATLTTL